jgi:acyl carrier protein
MDVAEEVRLVVSNSLQIPIAQLTEEIRLEDLGAESLRIIEMVFDLEEKFDIFIKLDGAGLAAGTTKGEAGIAAFATIGDVCRAVKGLVDAKAIR